jgi:hypothetical protein
MNLSTRAKVFRRIANYLREHGPADTLRLAAVGRTDRYSMSGLLHFHQRVGRVRKVRLATVGRNAKPAVWDLTSTNPETAQ